MTFDYTILSAQWGNSQHTSAILMTQEAGAVLAGPDMPEKWQAFQDWLDDGGQPAPEIALTWMVPRIKIVERLSAAGKLDDLLAWLNQNSLRRARWDAVMELASNDTQVRNALTNLGVDPDVILAP